MSSASLSALEERALLHALEAPTQAEKQRQQRQQKQAKAAQQAHPSRSHVVSPLMLPARSDRAKEPKPLEMPSRSVAAPAHPSVASLLPSLRQQARDNPLAMSAANRLLLQSATAMQQRPAAQQQRRHSGNSGGGGSGPSDSGRSVSHPRVPSFAVDSDIVRGSARSFQRRLYSLLWGEASESDVEGVHPLVSATKQAQELFAELNVADVLMYGRTGTVTVPPFASHAHPGQSGTALGTARSGPSTSRSGASARPLSSASTRRSISGNGAAASSVSGAAGPGLPAGTAPAAPQVWYYLSTTAVTNEKKLCRKVDFDHRHVVPQFESREAESPLLSLGAGGVVTGPAGSAPAGGAGGALAKSPRSASQRAPTSKTNQRTCEIICERFRLEPESSHDETGSIATAAEREGRGQDSFGMSMEESADGFDAQQWPPSGFSQARAHSAAASGSIVSPHPSAATVARSAAAAVPPASSGAGSSVLQNFQQRMLVHGRTDPTQTKLDKQYFDKRSLRAFLRAPYGSGALLKFIASGPASSAGAGASAELFRCTWVDKGPLEDALAQADADAAAGVKPSRFFTPPSRPTSSAAGAGSGSGSGSRYIKFLVQSRTNRFRLSDAGFSHYDRTLTYPHPGDHRARAHDLETEWNYDRDVLRGPATQAAYLKQRAREKQMEKERRAREREEKRRNRRMSGGADLGDSIDDDADDDDDSDAASPPDDVASLQAQRNHHHFTIRNYEAGSAVYEQLRSICDRLAAYFDLVLASSSSSASSAAATPAASGSGTPGAVQSHPRTKKMQLYLKRDSCAQWWLMWSDCLEFQAHDQDQGQGASFAGHVPSPLGGPSTTHGYAEHVEEGGSGEYDDPFNDQRATAVHAASSARFDSSSSSSSEDEGGDGSLASWRAPRRKRGAAAEGDLNGGAGGSDGGSGRPSMCAHCRISIPRHDTFFLQLITLLHTWQHERSNGFFHQRKGGGANGNEWGDGEGGDDGAGGNGGGGAGGSQWQEAPTSLAEEKQEARQQSGHASTRSFDAHSRRRTASSGGGAGGFLSDLFPATPTSPSASNGRAFGYGASGSPPAGASARTQHRGPGFSPALAASSPTQSSGSLLRDQLNIGSAAAAAAGVRFESGSPGLEDGGGSGGSSDCVHDHDRDGSPSSSDPVPSFALFFDPDLTPRSFRTLCQSSRSYLGRDVPLCGKCVAHVWMDSFLLRERFGLEVNPVVHPLAQQRSLGAADGSGSAPAPANAFAWMRKAHLSPYDKSRLYRGALASEQAAAEGDSSSAALRFSEARGGRNFIALNVAQARSGAHFVSATTRKTQRDLSTREGKDFSTNPRAGENFWAHYPADKEDRDLALTMQRRMQVAGAPSADIYALDKAEVRRSPDQLERMYGLRFVDRGDGQGRLVPVRAGSPGRGGGAVMGGGVPLSPLVRLQSRPSPRRSSPPNHAHTRPASSGALGARSSSALSSPSAATYSRPLSAVLSPSFFPAAAAAYHTPASRRATRQSDHTFLTGLDCDEELELDEIVEGATHRHDHGAAAPHEQHAGGHDPLAFQQTPGADTTAVSDTYSEDADHRADETSAASEPRPGPNLTAGGSRMEERIRAKAERKAEREAREAFAQLLLQKPASAGAAGGGSGREGRSRSQKSAGGPDPRAMSPPTHMPGHEPRSTMALVFDRPLSSYASPPRAFLRSRDPALAASACSSSGDMLMNRALREDTWQRVREVQEERAERLARDQAQRLLFLPDGATEAATAHQPLHAPLPPPEWAAAREERANRYRAIRRSPSVERLRAQEKPDVHHTPVATSATADLDRSGHTDPSTPAQKPRRAMSASQSTPSLARQSRSRRSSTTGLSFNALAVSAYSSSRMPHVGHMTPAQIMARTTTPIRGQSGGAARSVRIADGDPAAAADAPAGSADPPTSQAKPNRASSAAGSAAAGAGGARTSYDPLRAILSRQARPLSPGSSARIDSLASLYKVRLKTPSSSPKRDTSRRDSSAQADGSGDRSSDRSSSDSRARNVSREVVQYVISDSDSDEVQQEEPRATAAEMEPQFAPVDDDDSDAALHSAHGASPTDVGPPGDVAPAAEDEPTEESSPLPDDQSFSEPSDPAAQEQQPEQPEDEQAELEPANAPAAAQAALDESHAASELVASEVCADDEVAAEPESLASRVEPDQPAGLRCAFFITESWDG